MAFRPNNLYRFILINRDLKGQVISSVGTFKTRFMEALRISEIMINPKSSSSQTESSGEYIEIVNAGNVAVDLENLYISLEDHETLKRVVCPLVTKEPQPKLQANDYALIVGNGFDKDHYPLERSQVIITLKQKTLCGGLSNLKRKTIRLERGEGHLVDRYGGYKWLVPEGQSVQRKEVTGLDEDRNYCYSSEKLGPTPGRN